MDMKMFYSREFDLFYSVNDLNKRKTFKLNSEIMPNIVDTIKGLCIFQRIRINIDYSLSSKYYIIPSIIQFA